MLLAIREKAQGWIAWVIVILITIPFALWGIQEYLGVGSEPKVAEVDGQEITQRMLDQRTREFRENLRATLGDAYRPDLFEDSALKAQVREAMIEERVVASFAADWNLRTSDAQARAHIASIPAFQRDGRFDPTVYEAALRGAGMTAAGFEAGIRQDLATAQLRSGIRDSAFVTDTVLAERVRLAGERRTVRYVRIPGTAFRDQISVDDEALRAYYDAHLEDYRTAERVRLAYVVLDATGLRDLVEVDEQQLRGYFDDHRAEFVAREERQVRHILVAVPAAADDAAVDEARARVAALRAELAAGADFASLAQANSDDPGSAGSGGDLGWIERGLMVPAFEDAAFSLAPSTVSEPVRTDFGFHLIEVTGQRGGSDAGFEDVRDQVDASYRRFEAENLYFDYAERLAEAAYENAASLTPAAEMLGLEVRESDWLTRDDLPTGVLASPRVINAAFSDDVLIEGHNSELIEIGPQSTVVVRVVEHEPEGVMDFEAHRAEITEDFIAVRAAEAAATAGQEALVRLAADETSLADVAAVYGETTQGPETLSRGDAGVPPAIVDEAFAQRPTAAVSYTGVTGDAGDYFVIAIDAVEPGDVAALDGDARSQLRARVAAQQADGSLRHVVETMRARSDIELLPIDD
jgi:peptidyl-prolyl cis-trans isomerase D